MPFLATFFPSPRCFRRWRPTPLNLPSSSSCVFCASCVFCVSCVFSPFSSSFPPIRYPNKNNQKQKLSLQFSSFKQNKSTNFINSKNTSDSLVLVLAFFFLFFFSFSSSLLSSFLRFFFESFSATSSSSELEARLLLLALDRLSSSLVEFLRDFLPRGRSSSDELSLCLRDFFGSSSELESRLVLRDLDFSSSGFEPFFAARENSSSPEDEFLRDLLTFLESSSGSFLARFFESS